MVPCSTQADWIGAIDAQLTPLVQTTRKDLLSRRVLHADERGLAALYLRSGELKNRHGLNQLFGLVFETFRGGRGLLDQGRVLLGDLIELCHRLVDLTETGGLLLRSRADLDDKFGHALDLRDDVGHRAARITRLA